MITPSTRALHALARISIRSARPARARAIVAAAARLLPRLDEERARRALRSLGRRGTCLSRALTIATRLEGARIAIGVHYSTGAPLRAHAWVVLNGHPLCESDPDGDVIALLDPSIASREWGDRPMQGARFA
jgi:hypothetical protein